MRTATIVILVISLTLVLAGGAILLGTHLYARANELSPIPSIPPGAEVEGVHVGVGPVQVDVNDAEGRVNVNVGPFGLTVDEDGVRFTGGNGDFSWGSWSHSGRAGQYEPDYYGEPKKISVGFDALDVVELELITRDIEIVQGGTTGSVELYERFEGEFSRAEHAGGRLAVKINDRTADIKGGFWSHANRLKGDEGKVIVRIPEGASPDLRIDTVNGSVRIEGVSLGNGTVDTVSGRIEVDSCTWQGDAYIDTASGSISVTDGSYGTLVLEAVSGAIVLDGAAFGSLETDSISGSVTLKLGRPESDYTVSFDSLSGVLDLNGKKFRPEATVGRGDIPVSVDIVSGSVEITTR